MAEVKIKCPFCNEEHEVDDSLLGESAECSNCEKEFILSLEEVSFQDKAEHSIELAKKLWTKSIDSNFNAEMSIKPDSSSKDSAFIPNVELRQFIISPDPDNPEKGSQYTLLTEIGQGGMGIVYRAHQHSTDRKVALKVILPEKRQVEEKAMSFLTEAVVTANLDHPNIMPVYDVGYNQETNPFYSMKEITGKSWQEIISEKSELENLNILLAVCDAIAYAHSQGVIHRDLKPENVMIGEYGEVVVVDWGLAAGFGEEGTHKVEPLSEQSSSGGTAAYMAPEMADCDFDKIGPASDIYLLGGILYQIVTGLVPHKADNIFATIYAAMINDIQKTDKTGELVDIAIEAMATKPEERFSSVKGFKDAVASYLTHVESIKLADIAKTDLEEANNTGDYTKYASALYGFKEAQKLWEDNGEAEFGKAKAAYDYADAALKKGDHDLAESLIMPNFTEHQVLASRIINAKNLRIKHQKRLKIYAYGSAGLATLIIIILSVGFLWVKNAKNRAQILLVQVKKERDRAVTAEKANQREKNKAIAAEQEAKKDRDRAQMSKQKAVSAKESAENALLKMQQAQNAEQFAKKETEKFKKIAGEDKIVLSRDKNIALYTSGLQSAYNAIKKNEFKQAKNILTSLSKNHRGWEWKALMYKCTSAKDIMPLKKIYSKFASKVAVSKNGRYIFILTENHDVRSTKGFKNMRTLKVVDREKWKIVDTFTGDKYNLKKYPGIMKLFSGYLYYDGKQNYILHSRKLKSIGNSFPRINNVPHDGTMQFHTGNYAISLNGKVAAIANKIKQSTGASQKWSIDIINLKTGKKLHTLTTRRISRAAMVFSENERLFATGCGDFRGGITIWDISSGKKLISLGYSNKRGSLAYPRRIVFAKQSDKVLTICARSGKAFIWDIKTGEKLSEIGSSRSMRKKNTTQPVSDATIAPNGDIITVGDKLICYKEKKLHSLKFSPFSLSTPKFSPDSKKLFVAFKDKNRNKHLKLLNLTTGTAISRILSRKYADIPIEFCDMNSKYILLSNLCSSGKVYLANHTLKIIRQIDLQDIFQANLSPNNRNICAIHKNGDVIIYNLNTNKITHRFKPFKSIAPKNNLDRNSWESGIKSVKYSNTGKYIITAFSIGATYRGSNKGDMKLIKPSSIECALWNAKNLQLVRKFRIQDSSMGPFQLCSISFDDKKIAIYGKSIFIYDVTTGELLFNLKDKLHASISSTSFSLDGTRVLVCNRGIAQFWDLNTGENIFSLNSTPIYGYASFSRDGDKALLFGKKGVEVWDTVLSKTKNGRGFR